MLLNLSSYRVTQREPEAKETWRTMDDSAIDEMKQSLLSGWDFGGGELVKNSSYVTKVGTSLLADCYLMNLQVLLSMGYMTDRN